MSSRYEVRVEARPRNRLMFVDEFCLEGEKDYERLQRSRGK